MSLTQITSSGIANGAVSTTQLAPSATPGPKITQIQITNSSGTVLDDTAISLSGGYIKITGTGFASGAQVIVNSTAASSTTFTSDTVLNAQIGAESAGTYVVYVVNTDGGVAIAVNGLTYSSEPVWVTSSTLSPQQSNVAISVQLDANGATTFALQAGSTLPAGLSLSSGGLLSGTISIETETTYSFIIDAIDNELQDSPRTFSLTVTVAITDPYFYLTTLLLPGNGDNNTTNNTFLDSSTNNLTVTRNGNTTQGNFSPFSQTGWSNYVYGGYNTSSSSGLALGTGDFTIEFFFYPITSGDQVVINWTNGTQGNTGQGFVGFNSDRFIYYYNGNNIVATSSVQTPLNSWTHVAMSRSADTLRIFINGQLTASASTSKDIIDTYLTIGALRLGSSSAAAQIDAYLSNLRIVKGTALYTAAFTPPTAPLTAIAGTSLLIFQSNRLIDNSVNNIVLTAYGNQNSLQSFSPFNPTIDYSTAVVGGSGHFDGTGDYLTIPSSAAFAFENGNFTVEAWIYMFEFNNERFLIDFRSAAFSADFAIGFFGPKMYYQASTSLIGTVVVPAKAWVHCAWVRNNGTLTMYTNGVNSGSIAESRSQAASPATIGAAFNFTQLMYGFVSGLRVVKGTAVYTANFTPPTAPPTAIANTSLLLNFTNGSIADVTSKNVMETVGNAKISTAVSKFGGSSMAFDGTGDYLTLPANNSFATGTGDFTIEGWIYVTDLSAVRTICGTRTPPGTTTGWNLAVLTNGSVQIFDNTGYAATGSGSVVVNTWCNFAFVRLNNVIYSYINGIQQASTACTRDWTQKTFWVGATGGSSEPFLGYINDLRFTVGIARYTSNFTPPTAAFPIQ